MYAGVGGGTTCKQLGIVFNRGANVPKMGENTGPESNENDGDNMRSAGSGGMLADETGRNFWRCGTGTSGGGGSAGLDVPLAARWSGKTGPTVGNAEAADRAGAAVLRRDR